MSASRMESPSLFPPRTSVHAKFTRNPSSTRPTAVSSQSVVMESTLSTPLLHGETRLSDRHRSLFGLERTTATTTPSEKTPQASEFSGISRRRLEVLMLDFLRRDCLVVIFWVLVDRAELDFSTGRPVELCAALKSCPPTYVFNYSDYSEFLC